MTDAGVIRHWDSLDEMAKHLGFTGDQELHKMIAAVDLRTPEQRVRFERWKDEDGTKAGLLKLSVRT